MFHHISISVSLGIIAAVTIPNIDCTKEEAKSAKDATVKIADDVCSELANSTNQDASWIELACTIEAGIVHVLLPRKEWYAIKATRLGIVDAGPGL